MILNTSKVGGLPLFIFRIFLGFVLFLFAIDRLTLILFTPNFSRISLSSPFPAFQFLPQLPAYALISLALVLMTTAILISIGKYTKPALLAYLIPFLYLHVLNLTNWNNSHYLFILLILLSLLTSPHLGLSPAHPHAKNTVPKWQIDIFRFQLAIVYLYSGLHKLLSPEWKSGDNLLYTLSCLEWHSLFKPFSNTSTALSLTYGGILFDLTIPFLLLFKKTRVPAAILVIAFHIINKYILYSKLTGYDNIGLFPLAGVLFLILFFDHDQIQHVLHKLNTLCSQIYSKLTHPLPQISTTGSLRIILAFSLLLALILYPLWQYIHSPDTQWQSKKVGLWNDHSSIKKATLDLYYIDPKTNIWTLYTPTYPFMPHHFTMIHTLDGTKAILKKMISDMDTAQINTQFLHIRWTIQLNQHPPITIINTTLSKPQIHSDILDKLFETATQYHLKRMQKQK